MVEVLVIVAVLGLGTTTGGIALRNAMKTRAECLGGTIGEIGSDREGCPSLAVASAMPMAPVAPANSLANPVDLPGPTPLTPPPEANRSQAQKYDQLNAAVNLAYERTRDCDACKALLDGKGVTLARAFAWLGRAVPITIEREYFSPERGMAAVGPTSQTNTAPQIRFFGSFFDLDPESQAVALLHELGHITGPGQNERHFSATSRLPMSLERQMRESEAYNQSIARAAGLKWSPKR